jgi:hypothetical protein
MNRQLIYFLALSVWILGKSISCQAQVQIKQVGTQADGIFRLSNLQNVVLDNKANQFRRIVITVNCKDDSGSVFTYDLPAIILESGLQAYRYDELDTNAFHFRNEYLRNYFWQHLTVPNGKYELCYNGSSKFLPLKVIPLCLPKAALEDTAKKISRDTTKKARFPIDPTQFHFINKNQPILKISPGIDYEKLRQGYFNKIRNDFKQPNYSFHGRSSLGYSYNPMPLSGSLYPSDFINGELSPMVKVYGIPISMTVLYTYDVRQNKPFFNQFNVSFNKREFQAGMMNRLGGALEVSHPKGELGLGNMGVNISSNTLSTYGNNPYSISSFNTFDKAAIQQYRYDRERLLKYKDSLEWADPSKVKNAEHLAEQLEFQNTMRIVEQQNAEERKRFEDSLSIKDASYLHKIKDQESFDIYHKMQRGNFPDKAEALEQIMPLSKPEKLFYHINSWSVGKSYFNYTPLSIMGVGVTGADIAVNFSKLYVQTSAGLLDMKQSLWFQNTLSKKYIVEGSRIGWGQPDKSHIHLVIVNFISQPHSGGDTALSNTLPQSNTIAGFESALNPFKTFFLKAEYMKSFSRFSAFQGDPYRTTSASQAFRNDALHFISQYSFTKSGTDLLADLNRIGGNYYTVGNPYLRNDIFNYSFRLNKALYGRSVQLHTGVRQENDNMDGRNNTTTSSQRIESGFSLMFKKLPTLSVNYLPVYYSQKIIGETSYKYFGRAVNFNMSSSYNTYIAGHSLSSTALFTHSVNENVFIRPGLDLYTSMLCENFFFTSMTSLRTILTYNAPGNHNDSLRSVIMDVSLSFPLLKRGKQTIGFKVNRNNIADMYYVYLQSGIQVNTRLSANLYVFHNLNSPKVNPIPYQPSGNLVQVSLIGYW